MAMRVVAISIEDESFTELDAAARAAGLSPTEFVRRAAASAVRLQKSRLAARRDEEGYRAKPVGDDEFAVDPDDLTASDSVRW